jgi:hypothetical protein
LAPHRTHTLRPWRSESTSSQVTTGIGAIAACHRRSCLIVCVCGCCIVPTMFTVTLNVLGEQP